MADGAGMLLTVDGAAAELETTGKRRTARRLREKLYRKLGGKAKRTPEIRKRRK